MILWESGEKVCRKLGFFCEIQGRIGRIFILSSESKKRKENLSVNSDLWKRETEIFQWSIKWYFFCSGVSFVISIFTMATLLYTIFGITAGASLHCAVRREISPCTCAPHETFPNTIVVTCERMETFTQVVDALQDRFQMDAAIWLKITHSQLEVNLIVPY